MKRLLLIVLALAVAAGTGWFLSERLKPEVVVAAPTKGPAVEAVYATGVVEPVRMAKVAPLTAARISQVLKRDGDTEAIERELATFNDREEAVDTRRWRELESRYLRDA